MEHTKPEVDVPALAVVRDTSAPSKRVSGCSKRTTSRWELCCRAKGSRSCFFAFSPDIGLSAAACPPRLIAPTTDPFRGVDFESFFGRFQVDFQSGLEIGSKSTRMTRARVPGAGTVVGAMSPGGMAVAENHCHCSFPKN